jgi:glycerophosphoryl diester phosphodiesterase
MIRILLIVAGFVVYVAYRTKKRPIPHRVWKRFTRHGTTPLDAFTVSSLEGIYTVQAGMELFGSSAIVKFSYTVEGKREIYHLSFFCEKEGAYVVCQGRREGNAILLYGYWRQLSDYTTGTIRMEFSGDEESFSSDNKVITFSGKYGQDEKVPECLVSFKYVKPIPEKKKLDILAHRGGARNVDFLPTSENSLEMIKTAARLGANGVEIDVRMTKDNVPVVIHDSFLSIHNVRASIYGGMVHNYTLAQLQRQELRKGGHTPTLEEALETVLYQTPLDTVWLDIKKDCDLKQIRGLQSTYLHKAKEIGRDLAIYIGIPDKTTLNCFQELEDYRALPSLCELEIELVEQLNANVWAPQYTGGFQQDQVQRMQQQGRKVFVWSLDDPTVITLYLKEGGFDGIVTNAAPVAFYTYYKSEDLLNA